MLMPHEQLVRVQLKRQVVKTHKITHHVMDTITKVKILHTTGYGYLLHHEFIHTITTGAGPSYRGAAQ